jgi:hypothetical protein
MRWCSGVARTFSRHSQQHAETWTRSLGRRHGGPATHDDSRHKELLATSPFWPFSPLFRSRRTFLMTRPPADWFDRPERPKSHRPDAPGHPSVRVAQTTQRLVVDAFRLSPE